MVHTKKFIIEAFWELLEEKPYNKITVLNIVDRCGISRNTFYYHFHDIPQLLEESIKHDTDQILDAYNSAGYPLECITPVIRLCETRRRAILHIYRSVQRDVFLDYLEKTAIYAATQYIETLSDNLQASVENKNVIIRIAKCAMVGLTLDWLDAGMDYDLNEFFIQANHLFGEAVHNAMLNAMKSL